MSCGNPSEPIIDNGCCMIRRTSPSSIWNRIAPAGNSLSPASFSDMFHCLAISARNRPSISGCGFDQAIFTGTSGRTRSGISTVEPA